VNDEFFAHALAAHDESRRTEGSKSGNRADYAVAGNMDASKPPPRPHGLDEEGAWRASGHRPEGSGADDRSQKGATALALSARHEGAAG
jgi:hypothetical protein